MPVTNEVIPFFEPGHRLTAFATAGVTGKKFCAISASRQTNGDFSIGPPAAGGRIFGLVAYDAAMGQRTEVIRGRSMICPVTSTGAGIAAFAEVEVDATGAVLTKAAGVAVGYAVTACPATAAAEAQIALY